MGLSLLSEDKLHFLLSYAAALCKSLLRLSRGDELLDLIHSQDFLRIIMVKMSHMHMESLAIRPTIMSVILSKPLRMPLFTKACFQMTSVNYSNTRIFVQLSST